MAGRLDIGRAMRIVGLRIKLTRAHMDLMRIPRRFWESDFELIPECEGKEILRSYLRNIEDMLNRGEGLLLWGPNGHGKTSAAVIVAMEARRRGASVLFVQAETLRQASIEGTMFSDERSLIERAREVDILVFDDLGKEHTGESGYTERLFENLFRERSASKRVTLVTTNLSTKSPADKPNAPSLKTRYIHSMLEVMREAMYPVLLKTHNWRDRVQSDMEARLTG
jgi:DNA replication protein DnaC